MNMKLPLSVIILLIWALVATSWLAYISVREYSFDANFKEIGKVQYHKSELKAWKAGSCYVFGVKFDPAEGSNQEPRISYFSNCMK